MFTDFLKRPFHLLDRLQNRVLLILVTGIFGILFMNLYLPFNVNVWYRSDSVPQFITLSSFGVIAMFVLALSQLLIREVFSIRHMKIWGMIVWFIVELLLLTVTMFFIYGETDLRGSELISEFELALKYTLLVLVFPYGGVLFYLYTTQKGESIQSLLNSENRLVNILDENGELHIAIDLDQLLFLQSADNYVTVCFIKNGKVMKELVRTTLKRLELELDEFPIRRCHRSYMVNINKISVSIKSNRGLELSLHNFPDEQIPVSKNYKFFFTRLINNKQ